MLLEQALDNPTASKIKLSKKDRRFFRRAGFIEDDVVKIRNIAPKTENQKLLFRYYQDGSHLLIDGCAGTGKSFSALYLSLKNVISGCDQTRVVVVRSATPTKDVGFLPGSLKEKQRVLEDPYKAICAELFGKECAYDTLKMRGTLEFMTTSYIRGLTLTNAIVIIDEVQNLTWPELYSMITRLGDGSRLIVIGDEKQSDLVCNKQGCLSKFRTVIPSMSNFKTVTMGIDDVVRSGLVKEFIQACHKIGYV